MGQIGCVAIVKDEARHIAEWLAWQFLLGFDTVFLLDNGSTDATAAIARAFAPRLDVRVFDYPNRAPDYQIQAYETVTRQVAGSYEWLAFFDTDEFLRLDDGLTLKTQLARRPEAAVAVSWAIFGSNGHQEIPEGLVVENFRQRSLPDFPPNRHVKSIIRPALMEAALNPHVFRMRGAYVDLMGRPVSWGHTAGYLSAAPDYAGGALNHYFTRSAAHWRKKLERGYPDTARRADDFAVYDRNEVPDGRLAARAAEVRALLAPPPRAKYRHVICACARWETPYITEWLTYYRALGFDHVFLYCNDDDPEEFYERILPFTQGEAPFVSFRYHARQGEQWEMYTHFLQHGLEGAEWVSFFDIDEFLRLPPGETVSTFMARFGAEVDCVLFNWSFFGPNGHKTPPKGSVLENFTARQANIHAYTKYVCRAAALTESKLRDPVAKYGYWHKLEGYTDRNVRTVNVLGEDMRQYYDGFEQGCLAYVNAPGRKERILQTAVVHHYAFRSERAFQDRAARGLGGNFYGQTIWRDYAEQPDFPGLLKALNHTADASLASFWAETRRRAWGFATTTAPPLTPTRPDNISRFKPATQSSLAAGARAATREQDAAGAVNGVLDGTPKFHTGLEDNPWWQVDLGGIATIREIHVHNTSGPAGTCFRDFALSVSIDGTVWVELVAKQDGAAVTGPYIWSGPGTAWARYARVTLLGRGGLHLDQVEIFGALP